MLMAHKLFDGFVAYKGLQPETVDMLRDCKWLESAQLFDMGKIEALQQFSPFDDILRKLPYPECWFESEDQFGTHVGVYLTAEDSGEIGGSIFTYESGMKWILMAVFSIDADHGGIFVSPIEYKTKSGVLPLQPGVYVNAALAYVAKFLSALRCVNVDAVRIDPPPAMQKARARRGKKPFFSHWVLVLRGKSATGEWLGGTHNSPRVHLRRSHFREYSPGKWTCVSECVVGNKSLGMVTKSYAFDASAVSNAARV